MELVGANAVDGGNDATEDVIGAAIAVGALDGHDIEGFFDDEDGGAVAVGVGVEGRGFVATVDEGEGDGAGFD